MFAFFRRRREAKARALIRLELALLAEYEREHTKRQHQRIGEQAGRHAHAHKVTPLRPHGEYDPDQKRQHVEIRLAGQVKPALLERLLREEVPDGE